MDGGTGSSEKKAVTKQTKQWLLLKSYNLFDEDKILLVICAQP